MYHTCGKDQSAALWYITDIALQRVVYCDIPRLVDSIYDVTSHIPRNLITKPLTTVIASMYSSGEEF